MFAFARAFLPGVRSATYHSATIGVTTTQRSKIASARSTPSSRISRLTVDEAEALVKDKTVSAGMLPKIAAIARLIRRGVRSAHIINGNKRNALLYEVFTDEGAGTMITP